MAVPADRRTDLVLVDWNMPNMNGVALVRRIGEADESLPLVKAPSDVAETRVLQSLKAGVNNYVVKPFTAKALVEKIQRAMAKTAAPS